MFNATKAFTILIASTRCISGDCSNLKAASEYQMNFKDDVIHTYMFEVTGKNDTQIKIECEDEADAVTFRLYKYDKQLNKLATMRFNNDNKIAINSKLLGGIYYIEAEQQGRKGAAYKLLIE